MLDLPELTGPRFKFELGQERSVKGIVKAPRIGFLLVHDIETLAYVEEEGAFVTFGTPVGTGVDILFVHGSRIDKHGRNNTDDRVADVTRLTLVIASSLHNPGTWRVAVKKSDKFVPETFFHLVH